MQTENKITLSTWSLADILNSEAHIENKHIYIRMHSYLQLKLGYQRLKQFG